MQVKIHDRADLKVARLLGLLLLIVALFHVTSVIVTHVFPGSALAQLAPWFDVDNERNVPTAYNGFLWAASAYMLVLLAVREQRFGQRLRWGLLGILFLYFGFDELLVLHERLAEPIRDFLSISDTSIFYHAWIIVALGVTIGLGGLFLAFRRRDRISREQKSILKLVLILAAGTILLEALGTQVYFSPTVYKLGPVMIEELFEMSMISFILYRLTQLVHLNR